MAVKVTAVVLIPSNLMHERRNEVLTACRLIEGVRIHNRIIVVNRTMYGEKASALVNGMTYEFPRLYQRSGDEGLTKAMIDRLKKTSPGAPRVGIILVDGDGDDAIFRGARKVARNLCPITFLRIGARRPLPNLGYEDVSDLGGINTRGDLLWLFEQ